MSTWETSKRYAVDYSVNLLAGEYYVIDSQGLLIAREGTAYEAVEAAIADAPATGAVIHVHTDCDGDNETVTIDKSGITLTTLSLAHLAGNTWQAPRFDKILIQADASAIKNTEISGLNLREVELQANASNVDTTHIVSCQIRPTESANEQGIRFTGTAADGYSLITRIIDCKFNDHMDAITSGVGSISFEQENPSCGQVWIVRPDYKPHDDNCVFISASGSGIKVHVDSLNYVNMGGVDKGADCTVVEIQDGGRLTDVKMSYGLYEIHDATQRMYVIDNSAADNIKFLCDFSHNTFSLFDTFEFIDNNAANGDWASDVMNGIVGHLNLFKIGTGHFSLGTPNVGSRFMFNVSFVEEVTEDFVPTIWGGPLRWYSFSTAVDTIDQDPDYLHPDAVTAASATRADVQWLVPADGYVSNLSILLGTAPGVGDTWTFTFEEDGVNQAVTVPITGAAVTGSDTANSFEVDKDDLLNIECAKTVAPAATTVKGSWAFQQKLP